MTISDDYAKNLVPKIQDNSPLKVKIDIYVNKISVDTFSLKMTVDYYITLTWSDYRIQYYNLKEEKYMNKIRNEEINDVWTPSMRFHNALGAYFTKHDEDTVAYIVREGEPGRSDASQPNEGKKSKL